jgi:hypothetical protein
VKTVRGGIWVLNIFAALWGVAAITVGGLPEWLAFGPVALSAALLLWGSRQPVGTGNPIEGKHVGRVVAVATAIELVAILVTQALLAKLHQPTAMMPAVAIIVGLHFLPLARWIPVPLYYRTGGALVAAGLMALVLPPADRAIWTGAAAALILWTSGIMLVRGGRG